MIRATLKSECAQWAGIVLILVGVTKTLVGCAGEDALKARTAEAAYLAEQLACVDAATTRNESVACRNAVKARWAANVDAGTDGAR